MVGVGIKLDRLLDSGKERFDYDNWIEVYTTGLG